MERARADKQGEHCDEAAIQLSTVATFGEKEKEGYILAEETPH